MAELPALVEDLRQAINRGDTDAFLAFFPADGVVEDWGRRFAGHAAIRGWSDSELIGAKGTLTILKVLSAAPDRVEALTCGKAASSPAKANSPFRSPATRCVSCGFRKTRKPEAVPQQDRSNSAAAHHHALPTTELPRT